MTPDRSALTGVASALVAASCCILPLALAAVGLTGAGLMHVTMRYEILTLPLGTIGLGAAWLVHFRQRVACDACRRRGERLRLAVLTGASVVVAASLLLRLAPSWTASLLQTVVP